MNKDELFNSLYLNTQMSKNEIAAFVDGLRKDQPEMVYLIIKDVLEKGRREGHEAGAVHCNKQQPGEKK